MSLLADLVHAVGPERSRSSTSPRRDDEAYGAEVHHFGPDGDDLSTVRFPPTDLAAVGRGHGFDAVVVRRPADLAGVAAWVAGPRDRPLLVDAKVAAVPAWWLEEAFRGH